MMVLLSWSRPIASAHNIGACTIAVNHPPGSETTARAV